MKNTVLTVTFLALAAIIPSTLSAQTQMVWDDWGLGFTLAPGMRITENNGETFSAERDDLHLSITPVEDAWAYEEDLANAVLIMMDAMEFERITDADEMQLNDLYGYFIEGQSQGVQAVVMALMDTASHRNFLVTMVYLPESRNQAINLFKSMYAYGD
ncbi:MAG: hypothetical protein KDD02_00045 [Phaeodactylibacter sp.]|nr:hypothetical protein [Phaeodactylibacter sp.]MCB9303837.1 hypothetical protein [Lewinellaceae bacterium]